MSQGNPRADRGNRALAVLTALTLVAFVALVLLARVAFGSTGEASAFVRHWDELCASFRRENVVLDALNESLHKFHPDRVQDARRLELYTKAIMEHERQLALLRALRRAEFGTAGRGEEEVEKSDSLRNGKPTTAGISWGPS